MKKIKYNLLTRILVREYYRSKGMEGVLLPNGTIWIPEEAEQEKMRHKSAQKRAKLAQNAACIAGVIAFVAISFGVQAVVQLVECL